MSISWVYFISNCKKITFISIITKQILPNLPKGLICGRQWRCEVELVCFSAGVCWKQKQKCIWLILNSMEVLCVMAWYVQLPTYRTSWESSEGHTWFLVSMLVLSHFIVIIGLAFYIFSSYNV